MEPRQIMLVKKSKKKGTLEPSSVGALENDTEPFLEDKTHKAKRTSSRDHSHTGLLHLIASYLEKHGFSKTLSAFLSEAQVEVDGLQAHSVDLEDMICKYLETSYPAEATLTDLKEQEIADLQREGFVGNNEERYASGKLLPGKKRKKRDGRDTNMAMESENLDKILRESSMRSKDSAETPLSDEPDNLNVKSKEKKKKRKSNQENGDSDKVDAEKIKSDAENTDHEILSNRSHAKSKEKENKKHKSISQTNEELVAEKSKDLGPLEGANKINSQQPKSVPETEIPLDGSDLKSKKKKKHTSICGGSHTEMTGNKQISSDVVTSMDLNRTGSCSKESHKIDSKKLKSDVEPEVKKKKKHRLIFEENGEVEEQLDQGKRRKENNQALNKEHASQFAQEGCETKPNKSDKETVAEQPEEEKKDGCASEKNMKEPNGSSEPRTANAFQRVKVDEVEFVDERLQDNSYWAKGGADNGYGAKAQEVLGQVRGRDFRHEKTKKKRGSYRGGQIDLQSHSIKFNYSDDE